MSPKNVENNYFKNLLYTSILATYAHKKKNNNKVNNHFKNNTFPSLRSESKTLTVLYHYYVYRKYLDLYFLGLTNP